MPRTKNYSIIAPTLQSALVWLVGIILAIVPLFATRYVFAGMGFQKAILLYSLVTVLIIGYLMLAYLDSSYRPRFNIVGWSFLALLVILSVSTVFSVQPYPSFWGAFNRMEGLVSWLYYFAFFVAASSILKDLNDWWQAIRIALVGTLLVVLYGLGQALQLQGLAPSLDALRVESTLGNPVFLGGYLAIAIPITLAWVWYAQDKLWRNIGIFILLLAVAVLALTLSRGSWIGGILGVLAAGFLYLYRYKRPAVKWVSGIIIVMLVLFVGTIVWLWSVPPDSAMGAWRNRIIRPESLEYRLTNWSVGWQAFKEKPLIGWGLESFKVAYDRYYKVPSKDVSFQESHVDRAHNEYVGIAVSGGILALLAYLILLLSALVIGVRRAIYEPGRNQSLLTIGLVGALVAYMVYIFTAFHLMVNILFFLLALAWFNRSSNVKLLVLGRSMVFQAVLAVIGIVTIFGAYYSILNPLASVRAADQGTWEFRRGEYEGSLGSFQEALSKNSFMSNIIRGQMALLASNSNLDSNSQPLREFRQYTGDILERNFEREPYNSYHHLIFGMYYGDLAGQFPDFLEKADRSFRKSYELAPGKGEAHYRWGQMYANLNQPDQTREKFAKALSIEPYSRLMNYHIGTWYISIGEINRGAQMVAVGLEQGYPVGRHIVFGKIKLMADILAEAGQVDVVEQLYLRAIDTYSSPQDIIYAIVELASLYEREGRHDEAISLARTLGQYELISSAELGQFMKELGVE